MYTYLAVLKDNVSLNKDVLSYFVEMDFTILAYYKNLDIIKIKSPVKLDGVLLDYIDKVELDRDHNIF